MLKHLELRIIFNKLSAEQCFILVKDLMPFEEERISVKKMIKVLREIGAGKFAK